MAHKKKIIKCFVCGTEWTAGEEEAHASTLKCPHCGMHDFAGNFIIKEKEEAGYESKLFKPQWNQPAGEKSESEVKTEAYAVGKTGGHTRTTYIGSGGSNAAGSSGSGKEQVYEYIKESEKTASKQPAVVVKVIEKKNEPKSVTEELTSGCFIVTATYGTGSYDQIAVFYRFRDEFLLKSTPGRLFTQAYYMLSPYPATAIRRSKTLKAASRFFLDRLARAISRLL